MHFRAWINHNSGYCNPFPYCNMQQKTSQNLWLSIGFLHIGFPHREADCQADGMNYPTQNKGLLKLKSHQSWLPRIVSQMWWVEVGYHDFTSTWLFSQWCDLFGNSNKGPSSSGVASICPYFRHWFTQRMPLIEILGYMGWQMHTCISEQFPLTDS